MYKRPSLYNKGHDEFGLYDLFISLLRIDSRDCKISGYQILETISSYLSNNGVVNYITGQPGNKTLIANLKAPKTSRNGLILFSHADTAPWDETSWTYHPLSGKLKRQGK